MPMHGEIVLSVARLKRVRAVDAAGFTMTVEAGLTLAEVHAAADEVNRLFPLSLPSEGSCRIGGNLGTNAGGVGVLAYGNARQLVLGLEVVLADGRIWNGLTALKKDNTGYDLKDLFIGSEGTLGVITAAVLKLFPKPVGDGHGLRRAAHPVDAALPLFSLAQETAGASLTAFEVMSGIALDMVLKHAAGTRDPFAARHPWYALLEISGLKPDGTAERHADRACSRPPPSASCSSTPPSPARSPSRRTSGACAKSYSESQKPEGDSIKTDVSVPTQKIPEFIARADAAVAAINPEARPVPLEPLRRRQRALQHQPAGGLAQGPLPGAVEGDLGRGARDRAGAWRLDLGRARHRRHEARRACAREGPGGAGPDAADQGVVRPQGHPQSGQGAVRTPDGPVRSYLYSLVPANQMHQ